MDRVIIYPGAIPLDSDLLKAQRNTMKAFGHLAEGVFGQSPVADGLECTATSPPAMAVNVSGGMVTARVAIDGTAYGSLASDSNLTVKMGTIDATTNFPLTVPTSAGQSVKYLIQAAFDETDTDAVVLPYYNAAAPGSPYSGPANNGSSQNTRRATRVALEAKRGTPATTGSEAVPAVSTGYLPLWIVTVAYGQLTVTSANIIEHPDAPWVSKLTEEWAPIDSPVFTGTPLCPTPTTANSIANRSYVDSILSGAGIAVAATANTISKRDGSGGLTATAFHGVADSALVANSAAYATTSGAADTAGHATTANSSTNAGYATAAGSATTANSAATSDKVDGKLPATAATASTVAIRDSGGNLTAANFNGVATSAKFADLAERFEASEPLEPGDVVDLGGNKEIQKARKDFTGHYDFLGVISAEPGFRMNEDAGPDATHPFVAYAGRVPVKVRGQAAKGDYLFLYDDGIAFATTFPDPKMKPIGRVLEAKTTPEVALVLAVVLAK